MSSSQIPLEIRERVKTQAKNQCGYCLSSQKYVLGILEIDHIMPKALGGSDTEENLWLACRLCNSHKAIQTHGNDPLSNRRIRLFNPRTQSFCLVRRWSFRLGHNGLRSRYSGRPAT
jgi:5-methylcytosine-specific restriction endonuclease McrA